MIERDYLMRMITMLTAVIARILHLKKTWDYPRAAIELNTAAKSLFGADLGLLLAFSETQLEEMFGKDAETAPVRWYILGCLLDEHRDILLRTEQAEAALTVARKALFLLLSAYNRSDGPVEPGHGERIDELVSRDTGPGLPAHFLESLALYQERRERFARAEDLWWMLIELERAAVPRVRAFYDRLLLQPDETLEDGGLPRTEVEEGLQALPRT